MTSVSVLRLCAAEKIKKKTSMDKEPSMGMLESRRSSFTALTLVIRMCSTSSILQSVPTVQVHEINDYVRGVCIYQIDIPRAPPKSLRLVTNSLIMLALINATTEEVN